MGDAVVVHKPGSMVALAGGLPCRVLSVQVWSNGNVGYNVVWWDGRVRRAEYVEPCEVEPIDASATIKIGFHNGSTP